MADKKDKIVRAAVTAPTFINGVLHMPGEDTHANLTELGVDSLDDEVEVTHENGPTTKHNLTPGLEAHSTSKNEDIVDVPIAAVAPHAPNAPMPQGIAPGTIQSGTGRLIVPSADGEEPARSPVGADSEAAQRMEKPSKK